MQNADIGKQIETLTSFILTVSKCRHRAWKAYMASATDAKKIKRVLLSAKVSKPMKKTCVRVHKKRKGGVLGCVGRLERLERGAKVLEGLVMSERERERERWGTPWDCPQ